MADKVANETEAEITLPINPNGGWPNNPVIVEMFKSVLESKSSPEEKGRKLADDIFAFQNSGPKDAPRLQHVWDVLLLIIVPRVPRGHSWQESLLACMANFARREAAVETAGEDQGNVKAPLFQKAALQSKAAVKELTNGCLAGPSGSHLGTASGSSMSPRKTFGITVRTQNLVAAVHTAEIQETNSIFQIIHLGKNTKKTTARPGGETGFRFRRDIGSTIHSGSIPSAISETLSRTSRLSLIRMRIMNACSGLPASGSLIALARSTTPCSTREDCTVATKGTSSSSTERGMEGICTRARA